MNTQVRNTVSLLLLLAASSLSFNAVAAPRLDMSTTVKYPCVTVSVAQSNDAPLISYDPVSGLQFDILFDPAEFAVSTWTAGSAAAQHRLDVNPALASGTMRVLLYPNGAGTVIEGELFNTTLCRKSGLSTQSATLQLNSPVLGNSAGVLSGSSTSGNLQTLVWGPDTDGDGLPNNYDDDDDNDGMPDWYEILYGLNPLNASDALQDWDGDGVSNLDEFRYRLNPKLADSDGDGVLDSQEIMQINTLITIINSLLLE